MNKAITETERQIIMEALTELGSMAKIDPEKRKQIYKLILKFGQPIK